MEILKEQEQVIITTAGSNTETESINTHINFKGVGGMSGFISVSPNSIHLEFTSDKSMDMVSAKAIAKLLVENAEEYLNQIIIK